MPSNKQLNAFAFLAVFALLALCGASAHAATDTSRYLLTPEVMAKIKAAEADVAKSNRKDDDADESAETVEDLVKSVEKDPVVKKALAKQGLSSLEFAKASMAILHAGLYLMGEASMDKAKAAALFAGYTKEQQANINLVRKYAAVKK